MSIVNFSDVLSKQLQNKKLLLEFEEKFLIYLNGFKEEIIENNNVKNFELLLERYDEVIKLFKDNVNENKNINLFLDKLNKVLENKNIEVNYIYFVLYFFNCYKIYGKKFLELSEDDMWLAIELYCTFEISEELKLLDNLLDGMFEENLYKNLKCVCKDNKDVRNNYINAYEEFIENKNIPFLYYFKNYVNSYKKEKNETTLINNFENGILTPELIFENVKDSVSLYARLLYSSSDDNKDSYTKQKAIEIMNNLDTLVFKLKTISEPEKTKCLLYIRDMWNNKEMYLHEKIENIFNTVNILYDTTSIKKNVGGIYENK